MAQLTFEKVINLTEDPNNKEPLVVQHLMMGNEPNNDIWQYYTHDGRAGDKQSNVGTSNYDNLVWKKETRHLTTQKVRNIGIKTFPQLGAVGFYTLLNEERSKILAPIHIRAKKLTQPTFTIEETDTQFIFTIEPPADVTYICYRVILRLGDFATEYVTYDTALTVDKPYPPGTYDIYCVGYVNEGEIVSEDSVHYAKEVVGSVAPPILAPDIYATSAELDADGKFTIKRSDGATLASSKAVYTKDEVYSKAEVYTREDVYTKKEVDKLISSLNKLLTEANALMDTLNGEVV